MKFANAIAALAAVAASGVQAIPTATPDVECIGSAEYGNLTDPTTGLPCGYTLVDLTWVGVAEAGGPLITMNGPSLPDIEKKLNDTLDHGFSWETAPGPTSKRATRKMGSLDCEVGGSNWVSTNPIDEGINYLHGIEGDCEVEKGFQVCARVSCSWNAAIWLCNDTRDVLKIPCKMIGDYGKHIKDKCWFDASPGGGVFVPLVRGQQFDDDDWNVIVGESPDHC